MWDWNIPFTFLLLAATLLLNMVVRLDLFPFLLSFFYLGGPTKGNFVFRFTDVLLVYVPNSAVH